jgi:pimeloyl-ACP methyl ester carboxylesterase
VSDSEIKFDIVAHSMGGLLTRYYMRYGGEPLPEDGSLPPMTWAGARNLESVILVAPPNAGSIAALEHLVRGVKPGPTVPRYEPAIIGSMPSTYQTLPRGRHGAVVDAANPDRKYEDLYDPELWESLGWGLASPKQARMLEWLLPDIPDATERRRVALEHLRKSLVRARQFSLALDIPAQPPDGVSLYLMLGDAVPTPAVVAVDRKSGALEIIDKQPGDSVVLRSSALMDERLAGEWSPGLVSPVDWTQVTFIFRKHLRMTNDPGFTDNVLFILLER